MTPEPQIYDDLRRRVLTLDPSECGLVPSPLHPFLWGVVMDTTYPNGSATLVSLADGTTSLYLSSGGGTIGAGQHVAVAEATGRLLTVTERHLGLMHLSNDLAPPPTGSTKIIALGYHDVRSEQSAELAFGSGNHSLSTVFHAAHGVITEIRRLSQPEPSSPAYRQPDGTTELMAAAFAGRADSVRRLIDLGYRVHDVDDIGQTALMYAANGGQVATTRILLDAGADPRAADREANEAIMFAAQHGHIGVVKMLLDYGAEPNARGGHGLTALGLADQNGHAGTAEVLISSGAVT